VACHLTSSTSGPGQDSAKVAAGEAELAAKVAGARARMAELQAQWEVAKRPFEAQLEAQHAATRRQRERAEEQLRQIQEWRVETRELAAGARAREQEQQRLLAEYEAAPKNVNRATFVRRITEAGSRLTPAGSACPHN